MATTYTENGGGAPDGSDLTFTYSFETIETTTSNANSEVKVALDGVTQATTKYTVNSSPASITFNNTSIDATVQETSGAPKSGVKVRVYRDTKVTSPGDRRHTFQAGSSIKASALNDIYEHALFALDEEREQNIFSEDVEDGAVIRSKIGADAVDGTKIADDSINSEHYVAASIDNEHLADDAVGADELAANAVVNASVKSDAAIEFTKLENLDSGKILVGNGSNKATETAMSGDVTIDNAGATTITADAVQIGNISDTETTLTANSDAKIPTSKAVADHVVDVVNSVGGFVIVADKDNFPASHPDPNSDAGTVLSITNPNGLTVSSNTSSNGTRTGGSSTVTINSIPSSAGSTLTANYTMLVQTTSTEHTYDFYKFLAKDGDVLNLSNDINDFAARYRVNAGEPSSDNDEGDLVYDTSANKMKVYDGSAWGEVTSTGDFKYLALTVAGTADAAVYGSATSFDLKEGAISGAAASITSAAQLLVSVNGVIQKPNSGTSAPAEGFAMSDSDTIIFGTAPPSGSSVFAIQIGAATDLQVPSDNSITAAKLDLSIVQGDLIYGTGTDTWAKLAKGTAGKVLKMNSGATAPEWADDTNTDTQLTEEQVEDFVGGMVTGNTETGITVTYEDSDGTLDFVVDDTTKLPLTGGTIIGDVIFDNGTNTGKDLTWDMSDDALEFSDNVKAAFGDDKDFTISFNTSNIIFANDASNTGGDVYFQTDDLYISNVGASEQMAAFKSDGGCEFFFNNVKEFETKAGGVTLHGCSNSVINHWTNVSGSTTLDFTLADNHQVSLVGNATLANPTTETAGQSGSIFIDQDGTGSRTLAYGTQFKWVGGTAPTLSTAANAIDRIDYIVKAADEIHCVISLDVK